MIQGVRVDLKALRSLRHDCVPEKCIGQARGCCETYEVFKFVDPIDESEADGDCLATHEDGRCVFAYRATSGMTLCSLHSAGLDLELEPFRVKPKACALWPLYLVEGKQRALTVQEGALRFPCNHKRQVKAGGLDAGVAHIVRTVFGEAFLADLLQRL